MHLLGFRFAPRIRDLAETKLYIPGSPDDYPAVAPMIGGTYRENLIRSHWDEIVRLATPNGYLAHMIYRAQHHKGCACWQGGRQILHRKDAR
jgi:hypothetical protein